LHGEPLLIHKVTETHRSATLRTLRQADGAPLAVVGVTLSLNQPYGMEEFFEETHSYALIIPYATIDVQDIRSAPLTYVVRRDTLQHEYTLLDSIRPQSINAADSNVIVYTEIGEEYTYLVSLKLSQIISRDTLLMMKNDDPANWLKTAPSRMLISISDSILVLPNRTFLNKEAVIIKILPHYEWEVELMIPNIRSVSMSHDFTQILICLDSCFKETFTRGSVMIYDLASDSMYSLSDLRDSNYVAKRRSRNSPIFVLKRHNKQTAIWSFSNQGNAIKIAENEPNEMITSFSLYYNRLFLVSRDDSDSSRIRYPTRTVYD
jgi:hypothetical protein